MTSKADPMKVLGNATVAFWLLALGYLGFYFYGLLMGVFSPGQMLGFSVAAAILAALFIVHSVRLRNAMREGDRGELVRGVHRYRERRGF